MQLAARSLVFALVSLALACGGAGSATVTGGFNGYAVKPQTVYSWVEATQLDPAKLTYTARETKALDVVLSGASFDPTRDPRFISFDDRLALLDEESLNGLVSFRVKDLSKIVVGTPLALGDDGHPLELRALDFGEQELTSDTHYPAGALVLGSKLTATVIFDAVGANPGDTFAGTFTIKVDKGDHDPASAVTGELAFKFEAPVIPEILGGCWSRGAARAVDGKECDPGAPNFGR